jgi:hypothetical protein
MITLPRKVFRQQARPDDVQTKSEALISATARQKSLHYAKTRSGGRLSLRWDYRTNKRIAKIVVSDDVLL